MKTCPKCKAQWSNTQEYCICGFKFEKAFDIFEFLKNPTQKYGGVEVAKESK